MFCVVVLGLPEGLGFEGDSGVGVWAEAEGVGASEGGVEEVL